MSNDCWTVSIGHDAGQTPEPERDVVLWLQNTPLDLAARVGETVNEWCAERHPDKEAYVGTGTPRGYPIFLMKRRDIA